MKAIFSNFDKKKCKVLFLVYIKTLVSKVDCAETWHLYKCIKNIYTHL